jgi:hypothetical protein
MSNDDVTTQLAAILKMREATEKPAAYASLIAAKAAAHDIDALVAIVQHGIVKEGRDSTGRTYVTPALLGNIIALLTTTETTEAEDEKETGLTLRELSKLGEATWTALRDENAAYAFAEQLMKATEAYAQLQQVRSLLSNFPLSFARRTSLPPCLPRVVNVVFPASSKKARLL